ncbi:MAG: sigma 54-interacting transcriptional regulator [Deltaproteobacteria bacterium]|nr:sigma 54-interacting transcriptional regulator [Deltaproteobacteria bacterium]
MAAPGKSHSFEQFKLQFKNDAICEQYLFKIRWPQGFRCPSCEHKKYYELPKRKQFQCKSCGHQTTVTAGSVMHRTRTPLRYWFRAVYLITKEKKAISTTTLSKTLDISYSATRQMIQKIKGTTKEKGLIHDLIQSFNTFESSITDDDSASDGTEKKPPISKHILSREEPETIFIPPVLNATDVIDGIMPVAALFAGSFSIDWMIELTELSASKILSVFDKAIDREIIIKENSEYYCFKDEKQKKRFQDALDSKEKAFMHSKIAAVLLRSPIDDTEKIHSIAGHFLHLDYTLSNCRFLLKAGDIYRSIHRYEDAYKCYSKMLNDLNDKEGDDEINLYIKAAINASKIVEANLNSPEIILALKNAIEKSERNGMKRQTVLLELNLAKNKWFLSDYSNALKHFEKGFSMVEEINDNRLRRASAAFHIFYLFLQGRHEEVVNHYEMIMEDVEKYPHGHFPSVATLMIGVSYILTGHVTHGFGLLDSIHNHSLEKGNDDVLCQTYQSLGYMFLYHDKVDEALRYLEIGLQKAIQFQKPWVETIILTLLAKAYYMKNQINKSVGYLRKYIKKARKEDIFNIPHTALIELCWAMEQNELPRVGDFSLKREISRSIRSENVDAKGMGYFYQGLLLRRKGKSQDEVIQAFKDALKWQEMSGIKIDIAATLLELSKEYQAKGARSKAQNTKKKVKEIIKFFDAEFIPKFLKLSFKDLLTDRDLFKEIVLLSQKLTLIRDNKELVHHIISKANHITGAERGAIFILDKDASSVKLKLRAARNLTSEDISHQNFKSSIYTIKKAASTGDAQIIEINRGQQKHLYHSGDITSCICVPMKYRGEVVGVLYLDNRLFYNKFKKNDLEILQYFAAQASIAMDNVAAYEEIKSMAQQLKEEKQHFEEQHLDRIHFEEIVGSSAALMRVLKDADSVAGTDTTVLILGETGVGKELIARAIHRRSARRNGPFIRVNCSAFPDTLIASELFGHEKGAFTGAIEKRLGRFELANEGTLFLDEVGDISSEVQVRLLRVLQSKEFERVGGRQTLHSDFRLVAATNRDLNRLIQENKFREDLFFRLNVFPVHVPPIRDRRDDIPLLAQYFLKIYAGKLGKSIRSILKTDMESLVTYNWPGNVRELENVIERGVILSSDSHFSMPDLKAGGLEQGFEGPLITLSEIERHHIIRAINSTGGKIYGHGGAAEILDVNPRTLYSRMRKLNIHKNSR